MPKIRGYHCTICAMIKQECAVIKCKLCSIICKVTETVVMIQHNILAINIKVRKQGTCFAVMYMFENDVTYNNNYILAT